MRVLSFLFLPCLVCLLLYQTSQAESLKIGWAAADITPEGPVAMRGSTLSEGVKDPVTATALALEQGAEKVILISCDLQHITDGNRYAANMLANVRAQVVAEVPELAAEKIILMATHTHVAPSVQTDPGYERFASQRIAQAAREAWGKRQPGGISFGLGHAVIGHNRIATYKDGTSHMTGDLQKGSTGNAKFSHMEGFEDHSVHLLFSWDETRELTGIVINVPCPIELHAVRIGDVAMTTNPFEFYLDYGIRIKGRSPAVQTFVVQLAGSGSYLPTARAVAGGAYGAIPRTSLAGPVAGQAIVDSTLEMLRELWTR